MIYIIYVKAPFCPVRENRERDDSTSDPQLAESRGLILIYPLAHPSIFLRKPLFKPHPLLALIFCNLVNASRMFYLFSSSNTVLLTMICFPPSNAQIDMEFKNIVKLLDSEFGNEYFLEKP